MPINCLNCSKRATFGYENEKKLYCKNHKLPGMINLNYKKCLSCDKPAYYNYEHEALSLYCADHKTDDMIRSATKRCLTDGCNLLPSYNILDDAKPTYCENHRLPNMIKNKKVCQYENCRTPGKYVLPININLAYCSKHKSEGMIIIKSNKCNQEGCNKIPLFNLPHENKGIFCAQHKYSEMVNVVSIRCESCTKSANYNYFNELTPKYCYEHKLPGMVNINKNTCLEPDCNKSPTYNYEGIKTPIYCVNHKLPNMISTHKKCVECNTRPCFGLPVDRKMTHCSKHKLEGMINFNEKICKVDNCCNIAYYGNGNKTYCSEHKSDNMKLNKNNTKRERVKCLNTGCNKSPTFGDPKYKTVSYCASHKLEGMVSLSKKSCLQCKNKPLFGYPTGKALYCSDHKPIDPEIINLVAYVKCDQCDNPFITEIDNKKLCLNHAPKSVEINIKRLCKFCDIKPESSYVCDECNQNRNKKEYMVVRYLRKNIDTPFIYDSSEPLQGCSKRRPDIFFELLKHCVIVEVDEHQHRSYAETCECARISEIVGSIGGKSVIFIRFNPDKFKHKKNEVCDINIKDRLDELVRVLKEELIKEYDTFVVKVIQLYYDADINTEEYMNEMDITKLVTI